MLQDFFIKKMLKKQGVSEAQIDGLLALVKKNPELFKKMATEIQTKISEGMNQQQAAMAIMKEYESELRKLL